MPVNKAARELRAFAASIIDLCGALAKKTKSPFFHAKRRRQMALLISAALQEEREAAVTRVKKKIVYAPAICSEAVTAIRRSR